MTAKRILIVLSIAVLVLAAFFLGQRTKSGAGRTGPQAKRSIKPVIPVKKRPAAPEAVKPSRGARVAIVVDDFGYNTANLGLFFDIKEPLTFSVLPNLRHSRDVAETAKQRGYDVILHLPLASHRKDVKEEPDTIKPGENRKEVLASLAKDIESVPGSSGVSNHMGSMATEDKELMKEIFKYLKKRNLYFFDSLTSEKSVCREVAGSVGMKFAKRDMFLDNSNDADRIADELAKLEKLALKRGRAIAICHDRRNTAIALSRAMPRMAKSGIEFVYLSEMVE